VPVIENILSIGRATHVLVGGNVGKIFLKAAGTKFSASDETWLTKNSDQVTKARDILKQHKDQVVMPVDFGTKSGNERRDVPVSELVQAGAGLDIGKETIAVFTQIIRQSKTLVGSGPMGVFEQAGFEAGTKMILEAMAETNGFAVIGGGHLAGYAGILHIGERFSHVSTAGGAMLSLLAGEELPAIMSLEESAKLYGKNC